MKHYEIKGEMNLILTEICDCISLPLPMKAKVLDFSNALDERTTEPFIAALYDPATWEQGIKDIAEVLGEDLDGSKMLTIMLLRAAKAYKEYEKRGISKTIFTDTMKFCTRFTQEHYEVHGTYAFKWGWWFPRQISLNEFRIGALEYEMIVKEERKLINVHIPADADMTRDSLCRSYGDARKFFGKHFPEYGQSDMVCDSWLLSPFLEKLLPENSKIIGFQKEFDMLSIDEANNSAIRWVYGRTDLTTEELPEHTSLQKNIKACLLEGNSIGTAYGRLQEDPWKN